MNLDIKKNVIEKIRNDSEETIINTIDETVKEDNELALPGLGVMLELFWNDLNPGEKESIAKIIKNNLINTMQ